MLCSLLLLNLIIFVLDIVMVLVTKPNKNSIQSSFKLDGKVSLSWIDLVQSNSSNKRNAV